jgi:hypothetical protein
MPTAYKVLAQAAPSATTETSLYAPSGAAAVVSTLTICNQAGTSATYRVAIRKTGESSTAAKNWIVYGATVAANDTTALTLGITMESGSDLRVFASTANLSFSAFGSEIS